jgi:hypothetical protein
VRIEQEKANFTLFSFLLAVAQTLANNKSLSAMKLSFILLFSVLFSFNSRSQIIPIEEHGIFENDINDFSSHNNSFKCIIETSGLSQSFIYLFSSSACCCMMCKVSSSIFAMCILSISFTSNPLVNTSCSEVIFVAFKETIWIFVVPSIMLLE